MSDLAARFAEYERQLLVSPAVKRFVVLRQRARDADGYIRIRIELSDGGLLEVSEYWIETVEEDMALQEYTYHWQDVSGQLRQRWDNAAHFPDLPGAPQHVHQADGLVAGMVEKPTLHQVLHEIERRILRT